MAAKRRVKRFVRERFSLLSLSSHAPVSFFLSSLPRHTTPSSLMCSPSISLAFVPVPLFAMRRYRCGLRFISANESFRDAPAVHPRMGTIWRIRMRQRKSRTQKETFNGEREKREESRSNRGEKSVCEIVRPSVDETSRGHHERCAQSRYFIPWKIQ